MKTKHTPGPWECEDMGDRFELIAKNKDWIATIHGGREEDQFDAHLIAAAPDLLEALEYIVGWREEDWNAEEAWNLARKAFTKATGG